MAKTNGKTELQDQDQRLDVEHELPAADDGVESASEVEKLRAERDSLLDRLARLQADFENSRKRAAKERDAERAAANRMQHGRTKAERSLEARRAAKARELLESHKIDPGDST